MSSSQTSYRSLSTDKHDQLQADLERGLLATPSSYWIGLFTNAADDLQQGNDYGAINTEPGGGNYAQQEVAAGDFTTARVDGALRMTAPNITFNVVGAGQDVDSWFALAAFDYVDQDSTPTKHLITYGPLSPGGDRTLPDSGYYTVPLERPDRYILTDVNWSFDTSTEGAV